MPRLQGINLLPPFQPLKNLVSADAVELLLVLSPAKFPPELLLSSNRIFLCDVMEKVWLIIFHINVSLRS